MKNFPSPVRFIYNENLVKMLTWPDGYVNFSKNSSLPFVEDFVNYLCQDKSPYTGICESAVYGTCGFNLYGSELDIKILPTLLTYLAHFVSVRQAIHYLQNYQSGGFNQYDHHEDNMKIYGSSTPPPYNLKNVKTPIYLYTGSFDLLVSQKDVEHLKAVLTTVRKHKNFRNYNHCDFNYGKNSRELLYYGVLKTMNSPGIH